MGIEHANYQEQAVASEAIHQVLITDPD